MARNSRQSKILELISLKEIETQEELVAELKAANYDVTQATISRDIKELGLIKILSDNKNINTQLFLLLIRQFQTSVWVFLKNVLFQLKMPWTLLC